MLLNKVANASRRRIGKRSRLSVLGSKCLKNLTLDLDRVEYVALRRFSNVVVALRKKYFFFFGWL